MGFIKTSGAKVYLTKTAKEYIITGQVDRLGFDRVSIGDSDIDYRNIDDMLTLSGVPDVTGDFTNAIEAVSSNFDIRNKAFLGDIGTQQYSILPTNPATERGFRYFRQFSAIQDIADGEYGYTYVNRDTLTNAKTHIYRTFNLPLTETERERFDAKYNNTALQYLNSDELLYIPIPTQYYREQIDGDSIEVRFPSGGTDVVIYGRYFQNGNIAVPLSQLHSESNGFASEFGSEFTEADQFTSNVVFLFSDNIAPPISGATWADSGQYAVYSDDREIPKCDAVTEGSFVDKCVGIAYLDKGFIALTHPDIVTAFDFSSAKNVSDGTPYGGGQDFQDIYLDNSTLKFRSFANSYLQSLNYIIQQNEFNRSSNPTFDGGVNNSLYITEFGAYNSNQELLAVIKFDTPIEKVPEVTNIPISLKVYL